MLAALQEGTGSPSGGLPEEERQRTSLVKFLNQFSDLQQVCQSAAPDCGGPYFLRATDGKSIVLNFEELCGKHNLDTGSRFYLSYAGQAVQWPTLTNGVAVGNEGNASQVASEMARVVAGLLGYSQRQLRDLAGIDSVALRRFGLKTLRKIKLEPALTCDQARRYAETELGIKSSSAPKRTQDLGRLREIKVTPRETLIQFATIHKSKGLEADAVLVVAQKEAELLKWLQTDRASRDADTQDKCRIGFVAFSRAKSLLCLACLESATGSVATLASLGFEFLDPTVQAVRHSEDSGGHPQDEAPAG
jgi:DNA helicase II / ATP-dependent DNA helicase PcrA